MGVLAADVYSLVAREAGNIVIAGIRFWICTSLQRERLGSGLSQGYSYCSEGKTPFTMYLARSSTLPT